MDTKLIIAIIGALALIALFALLFFKPMQQEVLPNPEVVIDNNSAIELPENISIQQQIEEVPIEEVPSPDVIANNSSDIDLPEQI
ncbi:MAG: hypothetical protein QXI89_01750 [Candidatus Anstonellales archaeon]